MQTFIETLKNLFLAIFSFMGNKVFNAENMQTMWSFATEHYWMSLIVLLAAVLTFYYLSRWIVTIFILVFSVFLIGCALAAYFNPQGSADSIFAICGTLIGGTGLGWAGYRYWHYHRHEHYC